MASYDVESSSQLARHCRLRPRLRISFLRDIERRGEHHLPGTLNPKPWNLKPYMTLSAGRPAEHAGVAAQVRHRSHAADRGQGLTLLHFPAQRKHMRWVHDSPPVY